jgi:CO dehydrogenase maturation factor
VIDALGGHYRCVVVDNEAGMEHLSRRTTRDVQHLLIVSDPTQRGIVAAGRIAAFRNELDIHIENAYLIVNRLPAGEMPAALREAVDALDVPLLGTIPETRDVTEFEFSGRPLVEMKDDSPVYQAVAAMLERIL